MFMKNNVSIIKDCYGDNLKEIPINDMIDYLEKNPDDYWRYTPLLHMLKAFNNFAKSDELAILKYGH